MQQACRGATLGDALSRCSPPQQSHKHGRDGGNGGMENTCAATAACQTLGSPKACGGCLLQMHGKSSSLLSPAKQHSILLHVEILTL